MRTRVSDGQTDGAGYIEPVEGYGGSKNSLLLANQPHSVSCSLYPRGESTKIGSLDPTIHPETPTFLGTRPNLLIHASLQFKHTYRNTVDIEFTVS